MNFLIAPNALKGSLSAPSAAHIISQSLKEIAPGLTTVICPIADGGDGTLECLVQATRGKFHEANVQGPIPSLRVNARWGVLGDGTTAVIEMAEAAGVRLLDRSQLDIGNATTYGVGELILHASRSGFKKIIIGLGGSATNDGGAGCARALGLKFFDEHNKELPDGGIHLARLHHFEIKKYELGIKSTEVIGLADVTNVLYGPEGTARTFAEQKGASKELVIKLDEVMKHYASIIERDMSRPVSTIPGSGAAGGLGFGLIAFCGARIVSGIDFVLDTIRFDQMLENCDCVITAEGMIDFQTLRGKGIEGIARRARKFNKPVHAFVGRIHGNAGELKEKLGLTTLHQISPDNLAVELAMKQAELLLAISIQNFFSSNFTKDTKK